MSWINAKDKLPNKQYGPKREDDILFYHLGDKIRIGHFDGWCFISEGEPYMYMERGNIFWRPLRPLLDAITEVSQEKE